MKKQLVAIVAVTISIAALTVSWVGNSGQKKMAYFDYNTVYNECDLKKKLEGDLEKVVSARKSELDSLQLELSLMSTSIQSGESSQELLDNFETLKNRFLLLQNKYEEENIRLKDEYSNQIRTEINKKSKEFAEVNELDYLFSAVGDGSLMFAKESDDITDEFMTYLNQ